MTETEHAREARFPAGFGKNDVVAWGSTGIVVLDRASQTVVKAPFWDDTETLVLREREIYERLNQQGGHEGLLRYHGAVDDGIRLEYAPNNSIRMFYQEDEGIGTSSQQRLRWAVQIAETLLFVHSAGVVHGDLTCTNIFLDERFNAKLGDFAGSSLDGSKLLIGVTSSHRSPGSVLSTQGDIFAFGSVLYEIMTGDLPYAGLSSDEISARYQRGQFADTASLGEMGAIIKRCWLEKYDGFEALVRDLKVPSCPS
jgi:serine/threonine protein kinase